MSALRKSSHTYREGLTMMAAKALGIDPDLAVEAGDSATMVMNLIRRAAKARGQDRDHILRDAARELGRISPRGHVKLVAALRDKIDEMSGKPAAAPHRASVNPATGAEEFNGCNPSDPGECFVPGIDVLRVVGSPLPSFKPDPSTYNIKIDPGSVKAPIVPAQRHLPPGLESYGGADNPRRDVDVENTSVLKGILKDASKEDLENWRDIIDQIEIFAGLLSGMGILNKEKIAEKLVEKFGPRGVFVGMSAGRIAVGVGI